MRILCERPRKDLLAFGLTTHEKLLTYPSTYLAFLVLEPSVKWSWNRWPSQTVAQLIQAKLAFGSFTKLTQRLF